MLLRTSSAAALRAPARVRRAAFRILVACACVGAAPGCFEFGAKKPDPAAAAPAAPPVLVRPGKPVRRAMDLKLEISGEVEALTRTQISSRLSGLAVTEVRAELGDVVAAGAVLCVLDATDATRELADARLAEEEAAVKIREVAASLEEFKAQSRGQESVVAQAQKAYDRVKSQAEKGAVAAETLENAQYKLDQDRSMQERIKLQIVKAEVGVESAKNAAAKAKIARERAEQNLEWTKVRAPFAGVVAARAVKLGQIVQAGAALFELFDPATLVASSQVTQRDAPFVKKGQAVEIRSDALPGETLAGVVALVSPVVDQAAGTVPIRIEIADRGRLKPGLFVAGKLVLERRENALALPKKAVLYDRERPYVMKIEEDAGTTRVRRVFFKEGVGDRDEVEALFEAGGPSVDVADRIVLVGQDRLQDGDVVTLEAAASRAASRPGSDG